MTGVRTRPRDISRRWADEDVDRQGYITLLVQPFRIRARVFSPGKRRRTRSAECRARTRRNRVAQTQLRNALNRINRAGEEQRMADLMRDRATRGELQEPSPGLFRVIPANDKSTTPAARAKFVAVQRAWAHGKQAKEIAMLLGTTQGTVNQWINRMRKRGWTIEPKRKASEAAFRAWRAPKPQNSTANRLPRDQP